MKLRLPAKPSAACELLRDALREIYAPIDWQKQGMQTTVFDTPQEVMPAETIVFHTARDLARELGLPVLAITKAVHRGILRPTGKSTSGVFLFTPQQLAELRQNLTETK